MKLAVTQQAAAEPGAHHPRHGGTKPRWCAGDDLRHLDGRPVVVGHGGLLEPGLVTVLPTGPRLDRHDQHRPVRRVVHVLRVFGNQSPPHARGSSCRRPGGPHRLPVPTTTAASRRRSGRTARPRPGSRRCSSTAVAVVDLGLWSMEVTMRSSTTANVTGTMCGCRSAPAVARYPTRAAVIRSRHAC